jgi:hypothetical protein
MSDYVFKYNTLTNNRDNLIRDCRSIAENIDDYKGEILYLNYDIGTGKTRAVAEKIVAPLSQGKKILILTYSYLIVNQWKELVAKKCNELKLKTGIYALINPQNENFPCSNAEMKKQPQGQSLHILAKTICGKCKVKRKIKKDCPSRYKSKIRKSNVVITCNQLFIKNKKIFSDFDIIIFDEITTLDLSNEISLEEIDSLFEFIEDGIRKKVFKNDKFTGLRRKNILKLKEFLSYLEDYHKKCLIIQKQKKDYPKGIFKFPSPEPLKDEFKLSLFFLKILTGDLEANNSAKECIYKLIKIFDDNICTYIYPEYKYRTEQVEEQGKRYLKTIQTYVKSKIVSKNYYNIDSFLDSPKENSVKAAVLVLSALNTKDYVEHIFSREIKEDNCFGLNSINIFPNVITSSYIHGNSRNPERKSKSYFINNNYPYRSITQLIEAFIEKYRNDKVVIAGSLNLYDIMWVSFWDASIHTKHKKFELVSYNDIKEYKSTRDEKIIPYIHFGMSGTNEFDEYRAMLIINTHILPSEISLLYTYEKNNHRMTEESFKHNLEIVAIRQLEGRMMRFTDKVKLKYIHRLNFFDYNYINLSNPFLIFKQYQSMEEYFKSDIITYKDFNKKYIHPNRDMFLFPRSDEVMEEESDTFKEDLFYTIKAIEHLVTLLEEFSGDYIEKIIPKISNAFYDLLKSAIHLKDKRVVKAKISIIFENIEKIDFEHLNITQKNISQILNYIRKMQIGY